MADVMFNAGRGMLRERITDGDGLIIVLLKVDQADATLIDHNDLAAVLAAANTECDFTNYARKLIANGAITVTVDDTNERVDIDFADQLYTAAGGALNNSIVSALVCVDGASDAVRIPITKHEFVVTTDGSNLTLELPALGFYRSA